MNTELLKLEKKKNNLLTEYFNTCLDYDKLLGLNQSERLSFFPIQNINLYKLFEEQLALIWDHHEFNYDNDIDDYNSLDLKRKKLLDSVLAFFMVGDGAISKNIINRYLLESDCDEMTLFLSVQILIENVHALTYGLFAQTFNNGVENAIKDAENTNCVKRKVEFIQNYMLSDLPKNYRYLASVCSEGIFFCTLFAIVFWFSRSQNKLMEFYAANKLISRDETKHRDTYINLLISNSKNTKEEKEKYKEIILNAFDVEKTFIEYMLPDPIDDLNKNDLLEFLKVIVNDICNKIGLKEFFPNSINKYQWLDELSMERKENFFEITTTAYQKRSLNDCYKFIEKRKNNDFINNPELEDF